MRRGGCQACRLPNLRLLAERHTPFHVRSAGFSPSSPVGRGIPTEARTYERIRASYIRALPARGEDFPYALGLARAILLVGEGQLHPWPCHYESPACEVP